MDHRLSALGIQITIDSTEQRVGDYELDIMGHVEENDSVVIIENQLQCTDHSHLGQLITYAAGLDAAIVIWVAPEVRDEHRSAIEWLNTHMVDKISFFLVRPEVFKIDLSKPAVRFQVEASPDEWGRRLKSIVENEEAPRHEFRRKFWEDLLKYLASDGHAWAGGRSTTKYNWIN